MEDIIELLELQDIADAIIGYPQFGLGVGDRKRVTIGVELAAKPSMLLFLDEPTSGLDGQSAFTICRLLRKLADNGQTILCTIHQPRRCSSRRSTACFCSSEVERRCTRAPLVRTAST